MDQDSLLTSLDSGVLTVRFNRPEVFNAFDGEMTDRVAELLENAISDDEVRVVLLTGAGRAFSTGADVSGADAHQRFDDRSMVRANRMIRAVVALDKPVVAAVNGVAAGVGCSLALAADIVLAAESASFLLVFTRVGLMPDGGSTATLAAALGRARAMRMALLAEPLTAHAAYDAGLVSTLVPDADLEAEAAAITGRLAVGPPLALAATKRAVNAATLPHLEAALERERTGQTLLFGTEDVAEGMRAFSEKRPPVFGGC